MIDQLLKNILIYLGEFIDGRSLSALVCTCTRMNNILTDIYIKKIIESIHGPHVYLSEPIRGINMTKYVLRYVKNVKLKQNRINTEFSLACIFGNVPLTKFILENDSITIKQYKIEDILFDVVRFKKKNICKIILEHINIIENDNIYTLMMKNRWYNLLLQFSEKVVSCEQVDQPTKQKWQKRIEHIKTSLKYFKKCESLTPKTTELRCETKTHAPRNRQHSKQPQPQPQQRRKRYRRHPKYRHAQQQPQQQQRRRRNRRNTSDLRFAPASRNGTGDPTHFRLSTRDERFPVLSDQKNGRSPRNLPLQ